MTEPQKWPYYKFHDETRDAKGRTTVYTVLIDSDEGRTYEKLRTDTERLEYIQKHAHDSWKCVQPDCAFFEDNEVGKRYVININSPEYEGLEKLLQEDGSSPPLGTKEWDEMIQYYKDHATTVEDAPISSCDL
ncbi:uncharacterized protein F4822DRAFT_82929 [Hypoxylon trugodes]|uniref:uncharacterized protein n=1 Tax=Hypoxylon trugodes TaxID=326681 RepID=UPI00219FBA46|nr:uncharacterized protein F4822DRAFT_82929 [Hypoxylon trugodes]KAI1383619.1 hypothetical protein F4822DRAFT_82929 [Hypoxylon trugodes]